MRLFKKKHIETLSASPLKETAFPLPSFSDHYVTRLQRAIQLITGTSVLFLSSTVFFAGTTFHFYQELNDKAPDAVYHIFEPDINQIVNLSKKEISRSDEEQLILNYLKSYVTWRELIDHTTTESRDKKVRIYTNKDWFEQTFLALHNRKNSPRSLYAEQGMTRDIADLSIVRSPDGKNTYNVYFTAIDRRHIKEINRRRWMATIKAVRVPGSVLKENAEINPLSLQVFNYILREMPNEK